jgi:hypothetical protein
MSDDKEREEIFNKMMQQIHLNQSITLSKNESELLVKWHDDCQKVSSMSDPINPSHYDSQDGSEIDCLRAQLSMLGAERMRGYHAGNVLKYLWRWDRKNGVEDLRKAVRHIEFLVELEDNHEGVSSVVRGGRQSAVRGGALDQGLGDGIIRLAAEAEDGGEISRSGGADGAGIGEVS